MRKVLLVMGVCLLLSAGFVLLGCGPGEEEAIGQTTCPVMGRQIDKSLYEDYKGKRVYFCCPACPKQFKDDSKKYMKKMADEGVILEDAPK